MPRWPRIACGRSSRPSWRTPAGADSSLLRNGALHVALDADEAGELRRRFDLMRSLGLEAEWLTGRECRELEPGLGPSAFAGVHAPHESGVDPMAIVSALRRACESEGVEIVTGDAGDQRHSRRRRHPRRRDRGRRRAPGGGDGARRGSVVGLGRLAARGRAAAGAPGEGPDPHAARRAADPVAGRIVVSERVYLVPRADGRLIAGATVEEMGFDTRVTAGGVIELLREAYRALPDVAELELERVVAGLRPGTPDNAPIVGRGALDGLVLATGTSGTASCSRRSRRRGWSRSFGVRRCPRELGVADPARFEKVTT